VQLLLLVVAQVEAVVLILLAEVLLQMVVMVLQDKVITAEIHGVDLPNTLVAVAVELLRLE